MNKICGIYKITSPSGKVYIGQSIDIQKRFKNYKSLQNCKVQIRLFNSFLKYGTDVHIFEIIEQCNIEFLNIRERFWQDHYDCISKNGLNCVLTQTKDCKKVTSDETKISMSHASIKRVKEKRNNPPPPPMKGPNNPMFGKNHSVESINKMKNNKIIKKGKDHHNSSIFLDPQNGVYYFSVREVAEAINKSYDYVADRLYGKVLKNNLKIIKV